jgi:hypothetical protein
MKCSGVIDSPSSLGRRVSSSGTVWRANRRSWNDRAARVREWIATMMWSFCVVACQQPPEPSERAGGPATVSVSVPAPVVDGPPSKLELALAECRKHARLPCDVREDVCQKNLFELMQCLHGTAGATRPPLRVISEAAAQQRTRENRTKRSQEQAPLEHAAKQLGLHDGTTEPLRDGAGANAYYAPEERAVFFVANDGIPYDGELASFILGHEYIHALQDRDGALTRVLRSRSTRTFERELTLWSALEGEATLFEEVLRAFVHERPPRTWLPPRIARRTSGSDDAIVRQRRPLEAAFATFPYTYGAHFATTEWLAHGPPVVVNPTGLELSNRELLARRHGWPTTEDRRCAEAEAPTPLEVREALGAWLIQTYVQRHTQDAARARAAAMQSRGDWLSIDSRARGAGYGFSWRTCWDSANTALEMRQLIAEQLRETSGGNATVIQEGTEVRASVR